MQVKETITPKNTFYRENTNMGNDVLKKKESIDKLSNT